MGPLVPASTERYLLGEGPRWDSARGRLLWVDIDAGAVLEGHLAGLTLDVVGRRDLAQTVGAVAAASDGSLLVAAHQCLVRVKTDRQASSVPLISPGSRFNDGAVDPAGRFVVGTLSLSATAFTERLLRLEHDGSLTVLDDDLGLSNGLAWSADGTQLFSTDTLKHVIYVRDYDATTGEVGDRRPWLHVEDGFPDGIAVDQEDHLWVAVWGAGQVRRYSPHGALVTTLDVPAPHTSAVAFAGHELDVLVVTTAAAELDPQQLADSPSSGQLFTTRAPVPGLAPTPWRPCPLPSPLTSTGEHP
jgi:sugar lactone lactonase YvrE